MAKGSANRLHDGYSPSRQRRPKLDTIKMIDDGRRRRLITARGKTSTKKARREIRLDVYFACVYVCVEISGRVLAGV